MHPKEGQEAADKMKDLAQLKSSLSQGELCGLTKVFPGLPEGLLQSDHR